MPHDPNSHQTRLRRTRRPADYPLTLFIINPINRRLVRPFYRLGVAPTVVTLMSFGVGILGAAALWGTAQQIFPWVFVAPALVFLEHLLDCLDGDLARYSGKSSAFGAALDPILDRTGEFLYVLAIALGLAQTANYAASPDWVLWLAAMVCLGGNQVYFYTTDAQISRVTQAGVHDLARFSFAGAAGVDGTKLKFGLYEPYKYGLAVATGLGFGFEIIVFFASVFWLAWLGQIWKLNRITAKK